MSLTVSRITSNSRYIPSEREILNHCGIVGKTGGVITTVSNGVRSVQQELPSLEKHSSFTSIITSLHLQPVTHFLKNHENLFMSTKYLRALTLFSSIPKIYLSLKAINEGPKHKIIWKALECISALSSLLVTANDIISTALKITGNVLKVFACIGIVESVISATLNIRQWWKSRSIYNRFIESTYNNSQGRYGLKDYQQLCEFINSVGIKKLAKQFNVDEVKFNLSINARLRELKPINDRFTPEQKEKLREMMDLMKNQLESKKNDYVAAVISDVINLVGSALVIASIVQPYFIALWIVVSLSVMAGRYLNKTINAYKLENQLGMINREGVIPSSKVSDFFKWYFNLYTKEYYLKNETVDLLNKINKPLYI